MTVRELQPLNVLEYLLQMIKKFIWKAALPSAVTDSIPKLQTYSYNTSDFSL